MRALLDVNVLIALLDSDHLHHPHAASWLRAHAAHGWASCPMTQNACVRIMSLPSYPNALKPSTVIERLARATQHRVHEFWADDCSLLDPAAVRSDRVHGPKQVTDVYLLALAIAHGGRFVTFDASIPLSAVPRANPSHLAVL